MQKIDLNIRPKASILRVFSRLNYKSWYAIAEFVDNSTQSYYDNIKKLEIANSKTLNVFIDYDNNLNKLTIKDNAYGMELEDFKRAILVDSAPEDPSGRNEFGMGLKTAASWFGKKWTVVSTSLGSEKEYRAVVDIEEIEKNDLDSTIIEVNHSDLKNHYTIVTIENLTKEINSIGTLKKIKEVLSSMYRRDINSGRVNIYFNGEKLEFENYQILTYRDKIWKKDLNFNFDYNGYKHTVTGYVGILEVGGGYDKAGFALFRRDRVVIGGLGINYKPYEIFGQAQSPVSHKLFGELNLDTFPINQAKDGFVWDGGLEEKFIEVLKENIVEYIEIAKLTIRQRQEIESINKDESDYVEENIKNDLKPIKTNNNDITEVFKREQKLDNLLVDEDESKERKYQVNLDRESFDVSVKWKISPNAPLYNFTDNEGITSIVINTNHNFFKPYSNDREFRIVLEKLIIALTISEKASLRTSENKDGKINSNIIRHYLNDILDTWTK